MADLEQLASLPRLMEGCPDAIVLIDGEARIAWWNPAAEEMFGYRSSEVFGQKVELLMPEPYRSEHTQYIERYERTGEARVIGSIRTVQARRSDGEVFPIELSVTQMGAGRHARYAAFIRDVSDKQRLHRELLESERLAAVGLGASVFAHEVGNPINALFLQAQLLERGLRREDHPLSQRARTIVEEVRRLGDLLEEFRTFGRRQVLELGPVDVPTLMDEVAQMQRQACADLRVEVACDLEAGLPLVRGHHDKLKQVLLNLCKNAVEAMPHGGRVVLIARSGARVVTLTVEDTAGGLPEGLDVFQPFQSTKDNGLGLGLPIVRQIIDAHGGAIRYESESGVGTRFIVDLPVDA